MFVHSRPADLVFVVGAEIECFIGKNAGPRTATQRLGLEEPEEQVLPRTHSLNAAEVKLIV
jgi:hypothetical protein